MNGRQNIAALMAVTALLLVSVITALVMSQESEGATIRFVGGTGGGNYSTISSAVSVASNGDTIYVFPGVYAESLVLNKQLFLIGHDRATTKINAAAFSSGISVQAHNVVIKNINISGSLQYGIVIYPSWNACTIEGCDLFGNVQYGVNINSNNRNCKVSNCTVVNSQKGITLNGAGGACTFNGIFHNRVDRGTIGIFLFNGNTNNKIYGNVVTNFTGSTSCVGIELYGGNTNNKIYGNCMASNYINAYDDGTNAWDNGYPEGGNYYDDYRGSDLMMGGLQSLYGNDGIGDTPYNTHLGSNADRYPLYPYWNAIYTYHPQPGPAELCEYAIGTVKAAVIFVESDGSIDSQTETWSGNRIATALSKIQDALDWWNSQSPSSCLSITKTNIGVKYTGYEPIKHHQNDQGTWIADVLARMGYTSGDFHDRIMAHNRDIRNAYGTDWAFTIFMVDSYNDTDGYFLYPPNGPKSAWAMMYTCGIVSTWDNGNWTSANLHRVVAHEIGHMFYATDEYITPGERSGYLWELEVDNSGCLMDDNTLALSSGTKKQIGWRDTDMDGIQDIMDTPPNTLLRPQNPTPDETPYFEGIAIVTPYPSQNAISSGRSVTLQKITAVQYRVDNGSWLNAIPKDGAFNNPYEEFYFITTMLSIGTHFVQARAVNSVSNSDPTPSNATVAVISGTETIYVDDNFADDCKAHRWHNISFGVNDANPGDTVYIYPGNYSERILVPRQMTILGQNATNVWVNALGGTYGFKLDANGINLKNIAVINANGKAVWLTASYCTVTQCFLVNNPGYGVEASPPARYNRICHNHFQQNKIISKQANDIGGTNFWNASGGGLGNYWSDWTNPDSDMNGIVDLPYVPDGAGTASDQKPLVAPIFSGSPPPPVPETGILAWFMMPMTIVLFTGLTATTSLIHRKKNRY